MLIKRDLTLKIKEYLEKEEILLIVGPRQAGKTTIMKDIEQGIKGNSHFLNLEDPDYLSLLNSSPKNLFTIFPFDLTKKIFLFIDEIQYLDNPSNFLKYFFDEYRGKIKIIASGSSAFYLDKKFKDSLAGRKIIFNLLPLSFKEFVKFKNIIDPAKADLTNLTVSENDKLLPAYLEYLTYGGYPKVVLAPLAEKIEILRDLAYSYIKKDVFEAGLRQEESFYKLLKLLAEQIGNLINSSELANTLGISKTAVDNYLAIMRKSFHIALTKPFHKNIRKELTKMPKAYFIDSGLRNFFKNDFRPLLERDDKGQLLENAVFRQLADNYDIGEIRFWRTIDQKEVDFVINGQLALEVKWQLKNLPINSYQFFVKSYPGMNFKIATLDNQSDGSDFSIIKPWEV
ncbi:MAG TPA: ATP-binding protein [Patescibacteria group bacterium]|nr:ATP-binding protein [Patescibacteria group bacterium]